MKTNNINPSGIKTLFVCSGNGDTISPFILDQKKALEARGIEVDLFPIKGKGIKGYLKSLKSLIRTIRSNSYNFIHAHYGLSGLLAGLQPFLPVIVTLHGTDVNDPKVRFLSRITATLSKKVIVVSNKMKALLKARDRKVEVIPCGVNLYLFYPVDKEIARKKLEETNKFLFQEGKKYILFSSSFSMDVKNPELAKKATESLGENYELIELKGYSREEVALLLNAADAALMTSKTEGSPQFVKEAMACNCPVVSTDVGDVRQIFNHEEGCFISAPLVEEVAEKIRKATVFGKTRGRKAMPAEYKEREVTDHLIDSYKGIVKVKKEKKGGKDEKKSFSPSSSGLLSCISIPTKEFPELMEFREIILMAI